jgi:hypothetical protein
MTKKLEQIEMTSNPTHPNVSTSTTVAAPVAARSVKIKTLRAILLKNYTDAEGIHYDEYICPENREVVVTPKEAELFCDLSFQGTYPFGGERIGTDIARAKIVRAVRVA